MELDRQPETRNPECLKRWPTCEPGAYDPRCCRFPKSCSCTSHEPLEVEKSHVLAVVRASVWEATQFMSPDQVRKYVDQVLGDKP